MGHAVVCAVCVVVTFLSTLSLMLESAFDDL